MRKRVGPRQQRKVRKQIFVTVEQNRRLRTLSAAMARPEGELVREAIDDWMARNTKDEADWKTGLLGLAGIWADYPEIEEKLAVGRRSWGRRRQLQPR
jgi:predicted transcriptional regulator